MDKTDYREWLRKEFLKRKERNSNYSMRAFARDLNMSVSKLSDILNNKQSLKAQKAHEICAKLNWSEEETARFLKLIREEKMKKTRSRVIYRYEEVIDLNREEVLHEKLKVLLPMIKRDMRYFLIITLKEI